MNSAFSFRTLKSFQNLCMGFKLNLLIFNRWSIFTEKIFTFIQGSSQKCFPHLFYLKATFHPSWKHLSVNCFHNHVRCFTPQRTVLIKVNYCFLAVALATNFHNWTPLNANKSITQFTWTWICNFSCKLNGKEKNGINWTKVFPSFELQFYIINSRWRPDFLFARWTLSTTFLFLDIKLVQINSSMSRTPRLFSFFHLKAQIVSKKESNMMPIITFRD